MAPRRTPLYDNHLRLGARIIDFGGWALPVQYSSILEEHHAVRSAVGLFDVSHMGEFTVKGQGALGALSHLCTNDLSRLADGQARYTVVCYKDGGIVDDCIVYRQGPEDFLVVVNAANRDKDFAYFQENLDTSACALRDISDETALIAVQGPKAVGLVSRLLGESLAGLRSFCFASVRSQSLNLDLTVARTGYTGEDGFEIFVPWAQAPVLWEALLEAHPQQEVAAKPCGLGARDTLRLEACLSLYGNDIDATTTPYEANLGWVVKLDHPFLGREALEQQQAQGLKRRLCAFVMEGRGTARHGYPIHPEGGAGEPLGLVTSGSLGPTVGKNLGLGYVPLPYAEPGVRLSIDCRGKAVPALVVKPPFYKRPK